jgi:hypothetical protein
VLQFCVSPRPEGYSLDAGGASTVTVVRNSMDFTTLRGQGGGMFFSAYCHDVGAEVLLGPDNFVDLRWGRLGFELHYRCHCGEGGVIHPGLERRGGGHWER